MEFGDAPVPRPRGASAAGAGAVPIRGRVTARSASSTALLDGLAPPWQRMPEPAVERPAVRLARASSGESTGEPSRSDAAARAASGPHVAADGDARNPAGQDTAGRVPAGPDPAAGAVRSVSDLAARRPAVPGELRAPVRSARPRVVEEPSILGLSRRTRSRAGSRLFTLFFVAVFTLIALQMVLEILYG